MLALGLTPLVAFPWMHHRLKAYQRRNATYADRLFSFTPAAARFYIVYIRGLGFVLMGLVLVAGAIGALAAWKRRAAFSLDSMTVEGAIYGVLAGLVRPRRAAQPTPFPTSYPRIRRRENASSA